MTIAHLRYVSQPTGHGKLSRTDNLRRIANHAMLATMTEAEAKRIEGWGVIRPGDRRAHYYRDMTSLCRRVGFYTGPIDDDQDSSPDDCAACKKERLREAVRKASTP